MESKYQETSFHFIPLYLLHSIDDCNWWLCSFLSDIKFCKLTDLSFPTYIGFTSDAFCHWPFQIHLFPQIHLYHGLVFPLHLHQVGPPTPLLPPWAEARPVLPHQHIYSPSWTCSCIEKHLFPLHPHSPDLRYNTGHSHGRRYVCLFMGYVEHLLFQSYPGSYPQFFLVLRSNPNKQYYRSHQQQQLFKVKPMPFPVHVKLGKCITFAANLLLSSSHGQSLTFPFPPWTSPSQEIGELLTSYQF